MTEEQKTFERLLTEKDKECGVKCEDYLSQNCKFPEMDADEYGYYKTLINPTTFDILNAINEMVEEFRKFISSDEKCSKKPEPIIPNIIIKEWNENNNDPLSPLYFNNLINKKIKRVVTIGFKFKV